MNDPLNEVRNEIARKYLGKAGIHGIGISRARGAIRIYMRPDASAEQQTVLAEVARDAAPFPVLIVASGPPQIYGQS
jgi:hypothetical protein